MIKHEIYLAGPFFNDKQIETISKIEQALDNAKVTYYSPRRSGIVFKDLTPEQREAAAEQVFRANVDNIDDCEFVLACIDDRDVGTAWEMGYAYGQSVPIITFSGQGYGTNVMLSRSTELHCSNLEEAYKFIIAYAAGRVLEQTLSDIKQAKSAPTDE